MISAGVKMQARRVDVVEAEVAQLVCLVELRVARASVVRVAGQGEDFEAVELRPSVLWRP